LPGVTTLKNTEKQTKKSKNKKKNVSLQIRILGYYIYNKQNFGGLRPVSLDRDKR